MIKVNKKNKRQEIITDLMPDLTPLLDVIFMLIIFLILTANASQFSMKVDLVKDQEGISTIVKEEKIIEITLLPSNQGWKIGENSYLDFNLFKKNLLEKYHNNPEQKFIIVGSQEVSMQKLIDLLGFLKKQNIQVVDIAVERNS